MGALTTLLVAAAVASIGGPALACTILPLDSQSEYQVRRDLQAHDRREAVSLALAQVSSVRPDPMGQVVRFRTLAGLEGEPPPPHISHVAINGGLCGGRLWEPGDVAILYINREEAWDGTTGASLGQILRVEIALRPDNNVDPEMGSLIRSAAARLRAGRQ